MLCASNSPSHLMPTAPSATTNAHAMGDNRHNGSNSNAALLGGKNAAMRSTSSSSTASASDDEGCSSSDANGNTTTTSACSVSSGCSEVREGCVSGGPTAFDVSNSNGPLLDVATLLRLNARSDDDDDEGESEHVDGLETRTHLLHLSSVSDSESDEEPEEEGSPSDAESTSCSENSFEMSSATSFASTLNKAADASKLDLVESTPVDLQAPPAVRRSGPSYSQSMDSFLHLRKPLSPQAKEQISQELSELDTGLPELDFKSLEEKLSTAAREHEESERRKMGNEVLRRLALTYDQYTAGPSPPVHTRPHRSNLAHRLNASRNLQLCYMNELAEDDEDSSSDNDDDDEDERHLACTSSSTYASTTAFVPKSKSTPNLSGMRRARLTAGELARRAQPDQVGFHDRLTVLREETQAMLRQAKEAAKLQMEVERQTRNSVYDIDKIEQKRLSRLQLSRMRVSELDSVLAELKNKIDVANADLVTLLMEKDSLYMEQDSMLVDIEDNVQHTCNSESLNLPSFLYVKNPSSPPASAPASARTQSSVSGLASSGLLNPTKWKIFKR